MLTLVSSAVVPGVSGRAVTDFMLDPTDEAYAAWWPGTHRRFHVVHRSARRDHVGDRVLMDEDVGSRRLRMTGRVIATVPGRLVEWRLEWLVPMPVRLRLELVDRGGDTHCRHTVFVGFPGKGRVLDPLFRPFVSAPFRTALDEHVRTEFLRLGTQLAGK